MLNKYKTLDQLKVAIAKELKMLPRLHPVNGLVTPSGGVIEDLSQLEDKGKYIAIKAGFVFNASKVPSGAKPAISK